MGKKTTNAKPEAYNNKSTVILKIIAACMLLFGCSWFFFSNLGMFWRDLTSYMVFFPILFFLGILLVLIYITMLVVAIESQNLIHSDRFDIAYRIVFTVVFLMVLIRGFIGDYANPADTGVYVLSAPIQIIALLIGSGFVTWVLPRIHDNDSPDF